MSDKALYLSASANKMKSSQKAELALHRSMMAGLKSLSTLACHGRLPGLPSSSKARSAGAPRPLRRYAPAMEWDLKPKMKCAVCGGKRITLAYSPDTRPKDLHRKGV
ncbi:MULTISPECIES: hypothetical protein [unclassified Mesorhizobium]|uniref:hypothetical protein n=1 Tax=unclassified Mesorhizobium TaxID=325217 RepID=UPI00117E2FC2|nr:MULTISPECIES: hypothetical protein [unclassified Mesorhizobium]